MQPLRILTINTAKGDGNYRARIDWLTRELQRIRPDVIACQEAFRDESGALDTASHLMRRLGMHGFWAPARFKERQCDGRTMPSWSGLALLSRRPWSMVDTLELEADERDGERIAQFAVLEDERSRLVVANLHLTHLRDRNDLRTRQLQQVLSHSWMTAGRAIRLLCGDFNTLADGPVLAGFLGQSGYGHLQDAYVAGGGLTGRGSLVGQPGRKVDHVLSLADAVSEQPVFTSASVVLDRPDPRSGILVSDHFGVATTMVPLRSGSWRKREDRELVT